MDKKDFLEHERLELQTKLAQSLNGNNITTYKNLIQAYERILMLQREENRDSIVISEGMYVTTSTNGEINSHSHSHKIDMPPLAINTNEIQKMIDSSLAKLTDEKEYELYFEANYTHNSKEQLTFMECNIYFKGELIRVSGNIDGISEYIINLIKDDKVKVYGEEMGIVSGLVYMLQSKGIEVVGKKVKNERAFMNTSYGSKGELNNTEQISDLDK